MKTAATVLSSVSTSFAASWKNTESLREVTDLRSVQIGTFSNLSWPQHQAIYESAGWFIVTPAEPIPEGYQLKSDLRSVVRTETGWQEVLDVWTPAEAEAAAIAAIAAEAARQTAKPMPLKNAENRLVHFFRKYITGMSEITKIPDNTEQISATYLTAIFDSGDMNSYVLMKAILEGCERNVTIAGGTVQDSNWHTDAEWQGDTE